MYFNQTRKTSPGDVQTMVTGKLLNNISRHCICVYLTSYKERLSIRQIVFYYTHRKSSFYGIIIDSLLN